MIGNKRAKYATVELPIRCKPFISSRKLVVCIPKDLQKLLDLTEDNVQFDVSYVEGGLFYQIRRPQP